jgi:hypothetical protein
MLAKLAKNAGHHWSILSLSAIGLTVILITMASSCQASDSINGSSSQALITKGDAVQKIITAIVPNINSSSLRVHQYPTLLDAGSRVRQAVNDEGKTPKYLACEHQSWLFFIDLSPGAHFAHPAIIALLDAVDGEIKSMDAEWWPVIEVSVFESMAERQDPSMILFER